MALLNDADIEKQLATLKGWKRNGNAITIAIEASWTVTGSFCAMSSRALRRERSGKRAAMA